MTIDEFGRTIKEKYPEYQDLSDSDLGAKMLAKYPQYKDMVDTGLSEQRAFEIASGHQPNSPQEAQQYQDYAKNKMTTGSFGDITWLPRNIAEGITDFGKLGLNALGINKITGNEKPTFISPQEQKEVADNPALAAAKIAAGLSSVLIPPVGLLGEVGARTGFGPIVKLADSLAGNTIKSAAARAALSGAAKGAEAGFSLSAPGQEGRDALVGGVLGGIAEPVLSAVTSGMFTKSQVANKATQGAAKASERGEFISWDDLKNQIKSSVRKDYGDSAKVNKALDQFLAENSPQGIGNVNVGAKGIPIDVETSTDLAKYGGPLREPTPYSGSVIDIGNPSLTPSDLLDKRRALTNLYGKNAIQKAIEGLIGNSNSQLEDKVANAARRVISDNLHKLAPETITPDKLYHLYTVVLGRDLTDALVRIGGLGLVSSLLRGRIGGEAAGIVNRATQ